MGADLTSTMSGGRTRSNPAESAKKKRASRVDGAVYVPVLDLECPDCDRLFVPRLPGQTHCPRCRAAATCP